MDVAAADSSLRSTKLLELAEAILSLQDGADGIEAVGKADRALERIRRGCVAILRLKEGGTSVEEESFALAARQWLVEAVELVEDVLQDSSIVRLEFIHGGSSFADRQQDMSAFASRFAGGAVDSLVFLSRSPKQTSQQSYAHLDRAHSLIALTGAETKREERANWLSVLSNVAYNLGVQSYGQGKFGEALEPVRASCLWAEEACNAFSVVENETETPRDIEELQGRLMKRWEVLAICLQKCQQDPVSPPKATLNV